MKSSMAAEDHGGFRVSTDRFLLEYERVRMQVRYIADHPEGLSGRELDFVVDIEEKLDAFGKYLRLSPSQRDWLEAIWRKAQ